MKTPREILLARHRGAEPQLDQIRRRAVAAASGPQDERPLLLGRLFQSCREFFRIPPVAWAGLAAAWVLIIALNVASSETRPEPSTFAAGAPRRSPEMLQALREQKRFFTELVGAASEAADAEAPRFVPRPRSERPPQTGMA